MDLNIEWNDAYKVKIGSIDHWRRTWLIPQPVRSSFFDFWREAKFQLLAEGFRVYKEDDEWFLSETKLSKIQFKEIGITKSLQPPPLSDFLLPVYDISDDSGLRPWQSVAAGRLVSAIKEWGGAIDGSDTGCHAKGQLILMADGSMKKVEDIEVGDLVMGWKGPQKVTELKRGRQQMVKIIPNGNRQSWIVNLDHTLSVVLTTNNSNTRHITGGYKFGEIVNIKVRDWINLPKTIKIHTKLFTEKIDCWPEKKFLYSPYFLGLLLGDGGLSRNGVVSFTSADHQLWNEVEENVNKFGWKLGKWNKGISRTIINSPDLFRWLREVKLLPIQCESRFIPREYKTSSNTQRLQLLAGLIDSDGYYDRKHNTIYIKWKSRQLSEDTAFVSRSLGFRSTVSQRRSTCTNNGKTGVYYEVSISGELSQIPCKLERKMARQRKSKKSPTRYGFHIELMPEDEYYGFSLDGDGRFLLDDFTVTHNTGKTYSACAAARDLDMNMLVVCPKAVISQWHDVIEKHFQMGHKLIGVTNYEQLRIGKSESNIASYVIPRSTRRKTFVWKIPKNTLIIWDESQRLKNWKTKSSKTCIAAYKQGYKQLFCSATNATNPLELRTVGTCLKLFKGGQQGWYQWLNEHGCRKGMWGMEFTTDNKLRQKILKKLHKDIFLDRGVRLRRDTIPNFPECDLFAVLLDMEKEDIDRINSIYDEMEKELKELEKLQKLNNHNHLVVELRYRQRIELVKVPLFIDMIEEAKEEGLSVVVFVNFTETIRALAKRLSISCIFDGTVVGDSVRELNKQRFQNNEEQVILVNVMSGGGGLSLHDLQGGHPRLSIISPSYSPVNMRQAIGRIWRDDAKTKAIQKLVCVAHTVEENVYHNVTEKLHNLDLLNDGDLSYSRQYLEIRN